MKIALCIIATGRYVRFVRPLLDSAERFFCVDYDVEYHVFSDAGADDLPPWKCPKLWHNCVEHEPWPGPTLHRYHTILHAGVDWLEYDYLFYCDADMLFAAAVGDEILGPGTTAVLHPGFAGRPRQTFTYEYRRESTAYISPLSGTHYYAGGFQGGRAKDFRHAMQVMCDNIDADAGQRITAIWHDESHWNRYCIDCPPAIVLPPQYCSPASWQVPDRRLIALDKNHQELRA